MNFELGDLVGLQPGKILWDFTRHDWTFYEKKALFLVVRLSMLGQAVYLLTPNGLTILASLDKLILVQRNSAS